MNKPTHYHYFPRHHKEKNSTTDAIYVQDPQYPTESVTQLKGIQVQLKGNSDNISSKKPVIFDTVLNNKSSFISYDDITGSMIFEKTGTFYINWWVSTDDIQDVEDKVITFGIITSSGDNIQSSSPLTCGQICGNALIDISTSKDNPVTLQLINSTDGTICLSNTPIKANLTIIEVTV